MLDDPGHLNLRRSQNEVCATPYVDIGGPLPLQIPFQDVGDSSTDPTRFLA
jgi:hypothetical protein